MGVVDDEEEKEEEEEEEEEEEDGTEGETAASHGGKGATSKGTLSKETTESATPFSVSQMRKVRSNEVEKRRRLSESPALRVAEPERGGGRATPELPPAPTF